MLDNVEVLPSKGQKPRRFFIISFVQCIRLPKQNVAIWHEQGDIQREQFQNWFACVCLDVLTINFLQTSGSVSLYQAHSLEANVLITLKQKVWSPPPKKCNIQTL